MVLREVTYLAVALRILTAVIVGGILGLERGMKNRPAGLRTYMLVCVGSCLIMLTNQYLWQVSNAGDPMRLGAQVVSGIGFLGAGTIIVTKRSQIKGLTTAAGLWATAGLGLAIGIGFYEAALTGALAILGIFSLMQKMDNRMRNNSNRLIEPRKTADCGRKRAVRVVCKADMRGYLGGENGIEAGLNYLLRMLQNPAGDAVIKRAYLENGGYRAVVDLIFPKSRIGILRRVEEVANDVTEAGRN